MPTSDQEDQAEKRRVLLQDADVRRRQQEQSGTFLSHTHIDDAGGRFAAVNAAKIVGQLPAIAASYPAASAAYQTELPPEPSLGFSIDEMPGLEPSMATPCSSSIEATGDPADAPSSDDGGPATSSGGLMSERAGSFLPTSGARDEIQNQTTVAAGCVVRPYWRDHRCQQQRSMVTARQGQADPAFGNSA